MRPLVLIQLGPRRTPLARQRVLAGPLAAPKPATTTPFSEHALLFLRGRDLLVTDPPWRPLQMNALARLSLRYKTVTILLVALLLGVGIISLTHLNRELFPSLELPAVVVTAVQPGAAPAQVAEGLAGPIEDAFRGTTGIEHVSSTSLESD